MQGQDFGAGLPLRFEMLRKNTVTCVHLRRRLGLNHIATTRPMGAYLPQFPSGRAPDRAPKKRLRPTCGCDDGIHFRCYLHRQAILKSEWQQSAARSMPRAATCRSCRSVLLISWVHPLAVRFLSFQKAQGPISGKSNATERQRSFVEIFLLQVGYSVS
jgi:hypothetical protein